MSQELYLAEHIRRYPSVQPQDIVKFCYQAANGAEHLLKDVRAAEALFTAEYDKVPAQEGNLYEKISEDVCRIHLSAWKASGMPGEWLFRMFSASAGFFERDAERMGVFLNMAEDVICKETVSFSAEEWASYIERYMASGMGAVHHSQIFREAVRPAYRIISSRFLCILPILEKAARLPRDKGVRTLVLDGRAAAGKSTRAEMLKTVLDAEVIHMDDFFLPPVLRSTERLEEPGGNVHYERFMREVLPFLEVRVPFTYRRFSCSRMDYDGERKIGTHPWRIVEGSYSQHPLFGDYGDLRVFCDVEPEEQMRRIVERNGAEMAEMFKQRWIPMEERYFEKFKILSQADVCLKNEKVFVQY